MLRSKVAATLGIALAALAIVLVLRPVLLASGLPAFNHDWTWPPDLIQARALLHQSLSISTSTNFGEINYFVETAPLWAVNAALSALLGAVLGLKTLLLSILLAAGLLTYAMARNLGASRAVSWMLGIFYLSSPVVANELAAGHVGYLIGYACLPGVVASGIRYSRGDIRAVLGLIVLLPLAAVQPQFVPINSAVLLLLLFSATPRMRAGLASCAFLALCASPYAVAVSMFGHPTQGLSFDRAYLHWEAANSVRFYPAFIGAGYPGGYDALAPSVLLAARTVGAICLWCGVAVAAWRFPRTAMPFAAAAICAALFASGINGPLWNPISVFFLTVPEASLFRELYHISALVTIGMVVAISALQLRGRIAQGLIGSAILACILAQLSGAFWTGVHWYDPAEMRTAADVVSRDSGDGFVLFWPLLQPLGPAADRAGADPDAFSIATHPSLNEFIPRQPLSQIDALLQGAHSSRELLIRFGIRFVVVRKNWRSQYYDKLEPQLRDLARIHGTPQSDPVAIERGLRIVWRGSDHDVAIVDSAEPFVSTAVSSALFRLGTLAKFEAGRASVNPAEGWTDATRWQWWNAKFLGPVNPGLFALGGVPFVLPSVALHRAVYINAPAGFSLDAGRGWQRHAATLGFQKVFIESNVRRVISTGPMMLAGIVDERAAPPTNEGCARIEKVWSDDYEIHPSICSQIVTQIFAMPGTLWQLHDPAGVIVPPLATTWNLAWRVPATGAYELRQDVPLGLRAGLFLQYLIWLLSGVALCLLCISRRTLT